MKENIPLIKADLPKFELVQDAFQEILENGKITNFGKYVTKFEEEVSRYLGTQVATVSSGTMGLIFALQALGLEKGQKVVLPSFTFMATAQAVLYGGGVPIFAEVDNDLNLSPLDLQILLDENKDVAVVMPVHIYGLPCKVSEVENIVKNASSKLSKPISILYDAAHAFGAALNGKRVGGFGNAEVFSLSVTKTLVSVEGGLVSSRDAELIKRIRKMRNYGIEENYNTYYAGLNGKMSEFHAIIGLENLKYIERILATRAKNADYLRKRVEQETPFRVIPLPQNVVHTYKDFTILVPPELKSKRDVLMASLKEEGVETRAYFYPPVHEQEYFKKYSSRPLPNTEDLSRRVITLPFFTSISFEQMDYIVDCLKKAWRRSYDAKN